jgi:hypothetical protein
MEAGQTIFLETPDTSLFLKEAAGDDRLAVRFFKKAAHDAAESEVQKRVVFREVEMIQIMVPGDRDHIIVRPAGEGDKRRFVKHYEAWKRGDEGLAVGTPLELWGKLNLAQIEEFRYIGVRTIEQLASLQDQACQKLPGAYELKRQATTFLQTLKDEAPMKRLQELKEQQDNEIAALREALAAQANELKALKAKGK